MRLTKTPSVLVISALLLLAMCCAALAQSGCLEGDCRNGRGSYRFPSGNMYTGQFSNGEAHGQGTFTWANGNRYVGESQYGKSSGKGVFTFANGHRYVGEFSDNSFNGLGVYYHTSGQVEYGVWVNGQLAQPLSEQEFNARVNPFQAPPVAVQTPPPAPAPVKQADATEAERKRIAEEKARLAREREAQALLEKERRELAEERKRLDAEQKRQQNLAAERQRIADERARLEQAKAEKLRLEEERKQLAEEKARLERERLELAKRPKMQAEATQEPGLGEPHTRRVALVIGNSAYVVGPLKNPVNDAEDVAAALKRLGFEVILRSNADLKAMEQSVDDFYDSLRKGGIGLFYFAGHGVQVQGSNYLVPVDAQIKSESDVRFKSVDAGRVLGKMEDAGNGLNLVILDACRNNPFTRSFRSASAGLAKMDAPTGSLIAYSTAPGSVAADGTGKNGVYTKHLLQVLALPDLPVEEVFKRVRLGVMDETRKAQVPWEASSLTGYFYFNRDHK